jgi:hypothetical protein
MARINPTASLEGSWILFRETILARMDLPPQVMEVFRTTFYSGATAMGLVGTVLTEQLPTPLPENDNLAETVTAFTNMVNETRAFAASKLEDAKKEHPEYSDWPDKEAIMGAWVKGGSAHDLIDDLERTSREDLDESLTKLGIDPERMRDALRQANDVKGERQPWDHFDNLNQIGHLQTNRIGVNGMIDFGNDQAMMNITFGDEGKVSVVLFAQDAIQFATEVIVEAGSIIQMLHAYRFATDILGKGDKQVGGSFLADMVQWIADNPTVLKTTFGVAAPGIPPTRGKESEPDTSDESSESVHFPKGFRVPRFDGETH